MFIKQMSGRKSEKGKRENRSMVPFPLLRVAVWCCMCHDSNMQHVSAWGCVSMTKVLDRFTLWLQEKACLSNCLGSHIPILQSTMVLLQLVVQESPCLPNVMLESWHIQHHPATLNRRKGTMPELYAAMYDRLCLLMFLLPFYLRHY